MNTKKASWRFLSAGLVEVLILTLTAFLAPSFGQNPSTELENVASGMPANSWAELKTNGFQWEKIHTCGTGCTSNLFAYSDNAVWDPTSKQLLFLGASHYGPWRFVAYSAISNTWSVINNLPNPCMSDPVAYTSNCIGHGYDNNAIDVQKGYFYHHQSNTYRVFKYDIGNDIWSELPELPHPYDTRKGHGTALEYFPEMGGLIRVYSGSVRFFDEQTNTWSLLAKDVPMGSYHNIAKYNPVHKVILLGGGNNGFRTIHRLDATGKITQLNPAPIDLSSGTSSVETVDPVSGKYLVMNDDVFYAYDIMSDSWELLNAPVPWGDGTNWSISRVVATPVSEYGVTMFVKGWDYKDGQVFLYKHDGVVTSVDTNQESVPKQFILEQNYPNPFNPTTTIRFSIPDRSHVTLSLFNLLGREIAKLIDEEMNAGEHSFVLDIAKRDLLSLPSGIYFYQLKSTNYIEQKKLLLLK